VYRITRHPTSANQSPAHPTTQSLKNPMKATATFCLLSLGSLLPASAAQTIAEWTFEGNVTTPSTGSGTASLIGGTTGGFAEGNPGGSGWNTASYPTQGTGNGTAGVQFNVSTFGYDLITISYDHLASGAASRWSELQYTLNRNVGSPVWVTFDNNAAALSPQDSFTENFYDLSSVPGVDNNAAFAFRIVSVLSPVAFNPGVPAQQFGAFSAYHRAASDSLSGAAYDSAGTWLFDNINVGSLVVPVPEPGTVALVLAGVVVGWVGIRRRKA
jgi:hypothetical protein